MTLRIGTSEAGGTFHTQAVAVADLFNASHPDGEKCTVTTNLMSLDDLNRLDRGELEFAFMASNWIGRAKDGAPPFVRSIALRMVAPANAGPMFFVVLADSPIKTVRDFAGKRIALGPEGSGMAQHSEVIFKLLGISFASFTPVYLGFPEGAEALITGQVDAQWQRPIPNRVVTELSERADVRVVPYAAADLEKIISQVPFYRRVTIEKGAFRGVTEDSPQVAVVNVIVTHENISEQAVYEIAKTIAENLDRLPARNPLFNGLRDLFEPLRSLGPAAFEFGGVPLHSGAIRAYREACWLIR